MANLHPHEIREVRHIPREELITTQMWNVMREMSGTDCASVQSIIDSEARERALWLGSECL